MEYWDGCGNLNRLVRVRSLPVRLALGKRTGGDVRRHGTIARASPRSWVHLRHHHRTALVSCHRPNVSRCSTTTAARGRNSRPTFQLLFAIDRIRELAPDHPEWKDQQPFRPVLENDMKALAAAGEHGLLELVMASHAGMTTAV